MSTRCQRESPFSGHWVASWVASGNGVGSSAVGMVRVVGRSMTGPAMPRIALLTFAGPARDKEYRIWPWHLEVLGLGEFVLGNFLTLGNRSLGW